MQIAMVQPRLDSGGGAERVVVDLASGLEDRGHAVTIFTDRYDPALFAPPTLDPDAVRIVRPGLLGRLLDSKLLREPSIGRRLGPRLSSFDLVVVHDSRALRWIGSAGPGPPVLWYAHEAGRALYAPLTDPELLALAEGSDPRNPHLREEGLRLRRRSTKAKASLHRRRSAAAVARVARVTANSAYTAAKIEQIFGRPCSVCRPGVAQAPAPWTAREGFVLAVGPTDPIKNVHNVVEAVLRMNEAGRRTPLVVTGTPDETLSRWIRERDREKRVSFVGHADDEQLDRLYRTCRLLAYVPVGEPFGLVAIEAMARTTAIVASATGGPSESVVDGETGLLADPFDPQDIEAKIQALLDDDDRRNALGEAGRRRYEAEFTLDAFVERFESECRATVEA